VFAKRVLPDLNEVLCNMLFQMFGEHFKVDSVGPKEVNYPPCKDYLIFIQVHGNGLEGELLFTIDVPTAEKLLENIGIDVPSADKRELMHSALGELANVVTGQLMVYPSFTKVFGKVSVHPPIVWDADSRETCIPLREGISGSVLHGQTSIQTFISCTEANTINITTKDFTEQEFTEQALPESHYSIKS
jgi:CheY-specific phosphatase CheX